jgi:acyl-CoA dehydrogenase family protein 9
MLLWGILLHGKKVGEKEFFLRRVTALSLYSFGILSVLAKISRDMIAGSPKKSDLMILRCFLEEAKEARRGNKSILDTKKEKLGAALFQDLTLNS